jgi:hypothetical protein
MRNDPKKIVAMRFVSIMRQETSISNVKLSLLHFNLGMATSQHQHFSLPTALNMNISLLIHSILTLFISL